MHNIADIFTSLGIIDYSTTWNININILTIRSMTLVSSSVASMLCIDMTLIF